MPPLHCANTSSDIDFLTEHARPGILGRVRVRVIFIDEVRGERVGCGFWLGKRVRVPGTGGLEYPETGWLEYPEDLG